MGVIKNLLNKAKTSKLATTVKKAASTVKTAVKTGIQAVKSIKVGQYVAKVANGAAKTINTIKQSNQAKTGAKPASGTGLLNGLLKGRNKTAGSSTNGTRKPGGKSNWLQQMYSGANRRGWGSSSVTRKDTSKETGQKLGSGVFAEIAAFLKNNTDGTIEVDQSFSGDNYDGNKMIEELGRQVRAEASGGNFQFLGLFSNVDISLVADLEYHTQAMGEITAIEDGENSQINADGGDKTAYVFYDYDGTTPGSLSPDHVVMYLGYLWDTETESYQHMVIEESGSGEV